MKRSKLLLVSALLGTAYFIYLIVYFIGTTASSEGTEAVAGGLATALVAPHMFFVALSALFSWIGWAIKARWSALVSGILYVVSGLLMIIYVPFIILQTIFCFVSYAKMKKKSENQSEEKESKEVCEAK